MKLYNILPLEEYDLDEAIAVARCVWRAHYPGIISTEQINYMLELGYTRHRILAEMRLQGIIWLKITHSGHIIGLVSVGPLDESTMKLHKLYLLPEYHGSGLGTRALQTVEQLARESRARRLLLCVNKHNNKAISTYRRAGWTISGEVVNDIGNGFVMDDYVMTKEIGDAQYSTAPPNSP